MNSDRALALLLLALPLVAVGLTAVWLVRQLRAYRAHRRHMAELRRLPPARPEPVWLRRARHDIGPAFGHDPRFP